MNNPDPVFHTSLWNVESSMWIKDGVWKTLTFPPHPLWKGKA